jgi:hypothetical protein
MPKKSKEDVLRGKLEKALTKAGLGRSGKTFGLGENEGFCADYVFGPIVLEIITSDNDKRLEKVERFKKKFGYSYKVFLLVDDHVKNILSIGPCDSLFTEESIGLLVASIVKACKE